MPGVRFRDVVDVVAFVSQYPLLTERFALGPWQSLGDIIHEDTTALSEEDALCEESIVCAVSMMSDEAALSALFAESIFSAGLSEESIYTQGRIHR